MKEGYFSYFCIEFLTSFLGGIKSSGPGIDGGSLVSHELERFFCT
jgi:hypothetical protein